jgi:hypothetical protein
MKENERACPRACVREKRRIETCIFLYLVLFDQGVV